MRNDVYAQYATALPAALAGADVVVVRPATAEEVRRHTAQVQRLVQETRALYDAVTAPIIAASPPERLRWLDNIFDGTSEADAITPEKFKAVHFARLPGGEPPPEFTRRLQEFFNARRA